MFQAPTRNDTGGCHVTCGTVFVGEFAEIERGAVLLMLMTFTVAGADAAELPTRSAAVTT